MLDLLAGYPDLSRVALSSFDPAVLERAQSRRGALQWWLNANTLTEQTLQAGRAVGATAIIVPAGQIEPVTVARTQASGFDIGCWGIDRTEHLARLSGLGVTIAIADLPLVSTA